MGASIATTATSTAAPDSETPFVLFIGSSTCKGEYGADWVSFLPAVPGLAYCNRGVNGAMVPMLIDLVNSGEIPRPPRAVVVMVGGNDLTNFLTGLRMDARLGRGKSSPPLFAQEVSELLTLVEAKWGAGVRTAVFAVKPMGEVPGGELDKWTREYNAALQVWCMCVRGWGRGSGGGAWVRGVRQPSGAERCIRSSA